MSIDPARLARIRMRVLAAAALAVPACGGTPTHVNERPQDTRINQAHPDEPPQPVDSPINEHVADPPPTKAPEPKHINTPAPQSAVDPKASDADVNRPNPDAQPNKTPTVANIPPPGQTINVVHDDRPPQTINVRTREPSPAPKKPIIMDVNRPEGE